MDFIDKWRFKLFGRGIRVLRVEEVNEDGRIRVLRNVGKLKRRGNSLVEAWDVKGAEITSTTQLIQFISDDEVVEPAFVTYKGQTVNIQDRPTEQTPEIKDIFLDLENLEEVIGKGATLDDLTDALDLGKSTKNIFIGALLGAPIWWFVFQVIAAMAK